MAAGAAIAAGTTKIGAATGGQYAAQLGMQMGAQQAGGALSNVVNRLFRKGDQKNQWEQSKKYAAENQRLSKEMAEFNQNKAKEMADYEQKLQKQFYDYTYSKDTPAQQMKNYKAAGLNPALMFGTSGSGASGTTGGGSGTAARAETPQMNYAPMGYSGEMPSIMPMRETPAEKQLKEAEAANLGSQTKQRDTLEAEYLKKQIENITAGIVNEKAKTAYIAATTLAVELENQITQSTKENTIDMVAWTSKKVKAEMEIAENESYISKETREDKIKQIRQTLANSVIDAALKRATITHMGKTNEQIDADIENIRNQIMDRVQGWVQWQKGYSLDNLKLDLERSKFEQEKSMSQYPNWGQVVGRVLDEAYEGLYNSFRAIDNALGSPTPEYR